MRKIFVCKSNGDETRVPLVPADVKRLLDLGFVVTVEKAAGEKSLFSDAEYEAVGAKIAADRLQACKEAEIVFSIQAEIPATELQPGTLHVSYLSPFTQEAQVKAYKEQGVLPFSLEMIPRTTIAQKMDVQSSQTSLAGYEAVLQAATHLKKILPMMMTPAGNISPAKVFIIGVGVAGLQAIATAKRLGARVEAFDTRQQVEDQVRSLGAKFVKIDLGETAETAGGYAQALTAEQLAKQQEAQAKVCAKSDIVITTAKVFGKKAPLLVTEAMLAGMAKGSVVVDMAVAGGGNVAGSKLNETVVTPNGVTILSGDSLERLIPKDASLMFSGNMLAFLTHYYDAETKSFVLKTEDEIMKACLL